MNSQPKNLHDEPDIGSGEKSPGQQDTEKMIEQVGNSEGQKRSALDDRQPDSGKQKPVPGKTG
jgi:hypothetical protein